MKIKLFLPLIIVSLLAVGCHKTTERVTATYADGSKMLVSQLRGSGNSERRVGELRYYNDGTLQYEKHFAGKKGYPTGQWNYYYPSGHLFATAHFDEKHPNGTKWEFKTDKGGNLFNQGYDSISVVEMSDMMTPATVVLYNSKGEQHCQFYSDGEIRSTGLIVDGMREGHWTFYHPGGIVQAESDYVKGKEEGVYCVYRTNGIPYYRGSYHEGRRTGRWEFYDADGNLSATKEF